MDHFETEARSLQPDPHFAQILLELDEEEGAVERVYRTLKDAGFQLLECTVKRNGRSLRVLMRLSTMDMREAVRRLSESGFSRVKGINASGGRANKRREEARHVPEVK